MGHYGRWLRRKVRKGRVKVCGVWYVPREDQMNEVVMGRLEGGEYIFYKYPDEGGRIGLLYLSTDGDEQWIDGYHYCMFWVPIIESGDSSGQ